MSGWFVYVASQIDHRGNEMGYFKIGHSQDPEARLSTLRTGNPMLLRVRLKRQMPSKREASDFERLVHALCDGRIDRTEWFETSFGMVEEALHKADCAVSEGWNYKDFAFTQDLREQRYG